MALRVILTLVPIALVVLSVWLWVRVIPRQRERYRDHPEQRPYGWKLALRMLPFAALGVYCGLALGGWYLVLTPVMLAAFAWDLRKRWKPPAERS
jgi:hypothetical protein